MGGLGAPEIIIILLFSFGILILPMVLGYKAGAKRTIGAGIGLLLGLFLSFIGVIIVYCMPLSSQSFSDAADELQKYKQLLDNGAITESEYTLQKARILNRS